MWKLLPPGRLRRALIMTVCIALTAQGIAEAVLTLIRIIKEVLPFLAGTGYKL